jgi:hypothetical protein
MMTVGPIATRQPSAARMILILVLLAAASAHLPVIPEHLAEAPYMGIMFVAFSSVCVLLAAALISVEHRLLYSLSGMICAAALGAYAATRMVSFPMLADDRGNWLEPWGMVSVGAEAIAVVASVWARRARLSDVGAAQSSEDWPTIPPALAPGAQRGTGAA